ncbi:MAG: hypothetical protein K2Y39_06950 [Candidatus Obscuribacterales bacterium]|nr:hypothetical protein [Candidatus Obscuribacterales bacterium]
MPVDSTQQPLEDARHLIDASAKGLNADCIFQSWSTDRQMAAYRQLNKVQDTTDSIPDLTIQNDGAGWHIRKKGEASKDYCQVPSGTDAAKNLPKIEFDGDETWKEFRKIEKETRAERALKEADRLSHPEVPAKQIEEMIIRSLKQDEQAKLDVRVQLEKLMKEPPQFREQVLKQLLEDGSNPLSKAPYLTISRDESGNPTTLQFKSTRFGVTTETIHVNETLEEQVARANQDFIRALEDYPGGVGKFNPTQGMRCIEILMGADPKVPSWFMIHRQQQGLPMLDRSAMRSRPE